MNPDAIKELQERMSQHRLNALTAAQEADAFKEEVAAMKNDPGVYELTDDEERMLAAYRRFRCRSKPGATFTWATPGPAVADSAERNSGEQPAAGDS